MKKTKLIISSTVASLVLSGFASAGQSTSAAAQPAAASTAGGYFEIDGATGEATLDLGDVGSATENVSGVRLDGGYSFGNGFSLDGRYEYLEDQYSDSLDQFRAILNYKHEITTGVSAFIGAGYGQQNFKLKDIGFEGDVYDLKIDAEAILLNVGVEFTSGQFFSSVVYTHAFTNSATGELTGEGDFAGKGDLDTEDIGYLEGRVGYRINDQLSAILSLEGQVTGNTIVEKDWVTALGLRYSF